MKINISVLITFLLVLTLFSCESEEAIDEKVEKMEQVELTLALSGCWTEIENESILQFAGTNYTFCFISDTEFTLELVSWTDIVSDITSPHEWTEYIKGTYALTGEYFAITGNYVDSDFVNLVVSQLGETELARTFEVKVISENEMILDNNEVNPTRGIRLVN